MGIAHGERKLKANKLTKVGSGGEPYRCGPVVVVVTVVVVGKGGRRLLKYPCALEFLSQWSESDQREVERGTFIRRNIQLTRRGG